MSRIRLPLLLVILFACLIAALPSAALPATAPSSDGAAVPNACKPGPDDPSCPAPRGGEAVGYADIASTGPLTHVYAGVEGSVQVAHTLDGSTREFYPPSVAPGDAGTFLVVDGTLYAPHFASHGASATGSLGSYTPFTTVSQTTVTGAGTAANPYRVVTVLDAGNSGLRVIQTDSYVVGLESYRTDLQVSNSSGAAKSIILYRAADCYLGASDYGYGMVNAAVGAVACTKNANNSPAGRILQFVPLTGGSRHYEAQYGQMWSWIGSKQVFPNTCRCADYIDNAMGLSWNQSLPPGGQAMWSHVTAFSPLGSLPLTVQKTADAASSAPGTANGYTITISNPNENQVQLTAISDDLPAGFSYVTNSTTGVTTANPAINGQTLTWNGAFNVPAAGTVSLHFNVNVSASPGVYTNTARGVATNYSVSAAQDTAPITVAVQVGAVDMGFRPNPDGYDFANFGTTPQGDFTVDDLIQMFGRSAVCTNASGDCQVRQAAEAWRAQVLGWMSGGHCDGFTTTSLRFFKDIDQPATYQNGASATHDLALANIRRRISYFWALQVPNPVGAARDNALNKTPTQVLQQLYLAMSGSAPDPTTLIVYNTARTSGHSITPYAIEDAGNGVYRVRVYDNNYPNDSARFVTINTSNNTWSYNLGGGLGTWSGTETSHSLGAIAVSTYAQSPACPWCAGALQTLSYPPPALGPAATAMVQTALAGPGDLLITDSQGRRIGRVNGQFIDEMPAAFASVLPGGLGLPGQPLFYLPQAEPLKVEIGASGSGGDTAVSQYGPGYAIVADNVQATPGETQTLRFSSDGREVSLTPGTTQSPDLGLMAETGSGSLRLEIRGGQVAEDQTVSLRRTEESGGKLIYSRQSAGAGQYEVHVIRVSAGGAQEFTSDNVSIGQGDTHAVLYGAWDGSGGMTLQIDRGSNGSIDETRTLEDSGGPGSPFAYMPMVVFQQPAPLNPLLNGDFEQGATGWDEGSTHNWAVIVPSSQLPSGLPPHSGSWAAWLGGDNNETTYIRQTVSVPPAQPFLTYYHWIASQDACNYDFGRVLVNGGMVDQYTLCENANTGGWLLHSVNLAAYAGQTVTVEIQVTTDGSVNSNLFIDDVAFSGEGRGDRGTVSGATPAAFSRPKPSGR